MLVPAETIQKQTRFSFLQGGGEMGELTRSHNWAETELGPPENWPHSLCTTLGILLHSAFPMFLFWGKNLISFYNDAFRPSLGIDGKHPSIGKKGKDVWPEIWDYIGPMINQIMETGKPVWYEDQLVPFYRNGHMEDIYWTFCYSPVFGDDGKISGVFVTCTETTEKVLSLKKLEEANQQFQKMLMQAPVAIAVFRGENFIAEMANDAYLPLVGKTREAFVGKPLFETLPETRDILEPLALELVRTGQPLPSTEFEMLINRNGADEICYFNSLWEPVFDRQGKVDGFMVVAHEVTEQVKTRKIVEASDARMKSFFNQAPAAIAVLEGPELLFTLANPLYQKLFGRTEEQLLGKSISEVWPGNEGSEISEIFHSVYNSGKPLFAHDFTASFEEDGITKTGYFDFIAHPIQDNEGNLSNIMIHATEITGQVNARRKLEESEQQVRSLVESAPFPIGVYIGREMRIALANQSIMDVWGKGNDVIGKLYSEILPELSNQEIFNQLDQVYTTGIPFHAKYQQVDLVIDGKLQSYYFNYSFTPLYDAEGNVYGVMNTAAEVTDLVMAKQKVEESEQKYRSLVMEAPVGICIVSEDGIRVETVNDSFLEVIRKSRADFEGKLYWEAIPEAEEFYAPILKNVFETGTAFRGQEHELTLMRNGN
jgi:PAS domain S-box-containing protein